MSRRNLSKEKKEVIRKYIRFFTSVLILYMLINLLFLSRYSFFSLYRARANNIGISQSIERKKEQIKDLKVLNEELEKNEELWERIARERYGMQKEGETVIRFIQE